MENKEEKPKKHTIGKIEPKKMMAYPINEHYKDKELHTYECLNCETEYLSQGIERYEEDFCPKCEDHRFCEECCEVFKKEDCQENDKGEWYCDEHFSYKCRVCDEEMDEDIKYCSKECHSEYMADLMEDEYKEQYKNRYK